MRSTRLHPLLVVRMLADRVGGIPVAGDPALGKVFQLPFRHMGQLHLLPGVVPIKRCRGDHRVVRAHKSGRQEELLVGLAELPEQFDAGRCSLVVRLVTAGLVIRLHSYKGALGHLCGLPVGRSHW